MECTIQNSVSGDFDEVIDTTMAALEDEGFGILCDIDVQGTFEKKLNDEFRQYRILGACDPALAQEGLTEEIELGALLPCNVVYEADDGEIVVSVVDPQQLVGIADNDALSSIGVEVTERFERVLATVTDDFESVPEA